MLFGLASPRPFSETLSKTQPSPSPDHNYTSEYQLNSVNRHFADLLRILYLKPNPSVVDRFVEEGIIERREVDTIRKGYATIGNSVVLGAAIGSACLVMITRKATKPPDPINRLATDIFAGLVGALLGSQAARPIAALWAGEIIYRGTSNGGETALLVYKYMSAVKDPKNGLPPIGISLFNENGRPNFEIRRPLAWQEKGSTMELDGNVDSKWVTAKKVFGGGYDSSEK